MKPSISKPRFYHFEHVMNLRYLATSPTPPPRKTLKNIDNIRKAMDLPFAPPSAPTRFVSIRWPMVPTPRPVRYPPVSAKSSKTEKAATMFCPKKFLHSKMETWKHRNAFKTLPLIWGCFFSSVYRKNTTQWKSFKWIGWDSQSQGYLEETSKLLGYPAGGFFCSRKSKHLRVLELENRSTH